MSFQAFSSIVSFTISMIDREVVEFETGCWLEGVGVKSRDYGQCDDEHKVCWQPCSISLHKSRLYISKCFVDVGTTGILRKISLQWYLGDMKI